MKRVWCALPRISLFIVILLYSIPLFGQTPLEKGINELKQENYDEALVEFKEARKMEPSSTSAAYFLGITYKALGEYKEAVENLHDAVTMSPPIKEALPELIDALYVTDNIAEAKKWIAVGEKENIYPDRIQFMNGLILLRENRTNDAIAAFEKAKAANPATATAADFQIALANAKIGKLEESQRIFKTIITLDPTSDLANYAKDYERTITEKLDSERPFRFNIGLGFKYDSNVNAQPTSGTVFDNQNLASAVSGKEDTAVNLTLGATYIAPFSFRTPYSLSVQYSLYADRYFRRDDYNIAQQALSITPGYTWGNFSFMLPFAGRYVNLQREISTDMINSTNWWSNTRYMTSVGTSPTVRYMINDRNILEIAYSLMNNKYYYTTESTAFRDPDEDRDGISNSGSLGWTYFFKNATALLAFRYTYTDMDTDGNNWAYKENKFNFSFVYPLFEKFKFQFSSEASFVDYKNVNTIFDIRRRDEVYNNSVNFIYSITKNIDIFNQYSYMQDHCNISTYDFNRFIAMLGIEYRF